MPAAEDLLFSTWAPSLSLSFSFSEEVARSYSRSNSADKLSETDCIYSLEKEKLLTMTCKKSYCFHSQILQPFQLYSLQSRQQKEPW
ncbi:unnamed protein product [Bubo scandiacus]